MGWGKPLLAGNKEWALVLTLCNTDWGYRMNPLGLPRWPQILGPQPQKLEEGSVCKNFSSKEVRELWEAVASITWVLVCNSQNCAEAVLTRGASMFLRLTQPDIPASPPDPSAYPRGSDILLCFTLFYFSDLHFICITKKIWSSSKYIGWWFDIHYERIITPSS